MSELLTVDETAALLRVSKRTVYRLVKDRRLKITKVRGSSFVRDVEVQRYIKAAERTSAA